ncbi:hypothetical protein [Demequina sp.]|uniref:hypothetical protein n=1 Tax=Demequina sp. TaxID=2050685 RepID=UPI003D14CA2A
MSAVSHLATTVVVGRTIRPLNDADREVLRAATDADDLASLRRVIAAPVSNPWLGAAYGAVFVALISMMILMAVPNAAAWVLAAGAVAIGAMVAAIVLQSRARKRSTAVATWVSNIDYFLDNLASKK